MTEFCGKAGLYVSESTRHVFAGRHMAHYRSIGPASAAELQITGPRSIQLDSGIGSWQH